LVPAVSDRLPPRWPDRRASFVIPSLIAVAGAALLILQWQWGRMLWLDEEMIAINLRDRSFAQLAGRLSLGQAAPYGWLVAERAILLVFGPDERALRAVPLLFGVALLVVAVWVGRRWLTPTGAATLVLLCGAGQWISFHALELKHYSADSCFGLLIPALAVWAIEEDRVLTWWIVAAVAQWFSNGALFVVPVCALVVLMAQRRNTSRLGIAIWLVSFGLNFVINLGPVRSNDFLNQYWANAFPPRGSNGFAIFEWLGAQLSPLAVKPAGSGFGIWFWTVAVAGFALATGRAPLIRLTFGLLPISGLWFAAIRLVPMFERLALWMVPAMYMGVALAADASVERIIRPKQRALDVAVGLAGGLLLFVILADVVQRGTTYLALTEPKANHEVDDRAAVRWLARQARPGSVWITTHNALAAIWWYANDNLPALESMFIEGAQSCGPSELGETLRRDGATRALVYLGFSHKVPPPFDDTLLMRLGSLGQITAYSRFGESSHALVVDLREPPTGPVTLSLLGAKDEAGPGGASGCISVSPAGRW
jgi:hypothetical protein